MTEITCVDAARALCGEGLLWDETRGLLWWVDIAGETLHSFDPQTSKTRKVEMPFLISSLALAPDGSLLIATKRGMGLVDPESGEIRILHHPEPDVSGNRLNDILAGPDGALWVGTMTEGAKSANGALYRYGASGPVAKKTGTTISNGLAFSPDGEALYFIDSVPGVLHRYQNGQWDELFKFDAVTGKPDGLTVDSQGMLWIAICNQGRVISMSPEGEITSEISLPSETVTNCTFGGADLKTLFVTTGTFTMTDAEKATKPLAGGLFAISMQVPGVLPYRAAWPKA